MGSYEEQLLLKLIKEVIEIYPPKDKNSFEDKDVNRAFSIFESIKKQEKVIGEEEYAKLDLEKLFGIDVKGMTKNQMYNLHCSKMVNAIVNLIKERRLKWEEIK